MGLLDFAQSEMKPFFNARRTRLTAVVMLFVWSMALAIGMANACLITQGELQHSHPSRIATSADEDTHGPTRPADAALCLDVCAAEQATLVKAKQQFGSPVGGDAVPVLALSGFTVAVVDWDAPLRTAGIANWPELSVAIRFSRRTI